MKDNDQKIALDWIKTIESDKSRIRDTDIYPMINHWVAQVSPTKILEIGCGQGVCSHHLDLSARTYAGIDFSGIMINRATELYGDEKRSFLAGSAYDVPFPASTFDAAFSVSVLHLLENLEQAATELHRILKPQGSFLIISANPGAYHLWTGNYQGYKLEGNKFEGEITLADGSVVNEVLYLHDLNEIKHSLETKNLQITNVETFRPHAKSKGLAQFVAISGRKI